MKSLAVDHALAAVDLLPLMIRPPDSIQNMYPLVRSSASGRWALTQVLT